MKILVISQGPVPTPEHKVVEGGGLRCWGLAFGIKSNLPKAEITVAYHESYKKEGHTNRYKDIDITCWNEHTVVALLKHFDSIVVSYCMGDLSVMVADNVRPDQQLVLDCYVPIYVEVSARESGDIQNEYTVFQADTEKWARVLQRGDIFLCASEPQKKYYEGVLSGVGRINPLTYNQDLIAIVPYGIYRESPEVTSKPITKLLKSKSDTKKLLWFGGIYPWFDLKNLVDATVKANSELPVHLAIVGAKNPFNNHPDFLSKYHELVDYISENDQRSNCVSMIDWVEFDTRADWYMDSDLVVVVNKEGKENELAWRTRLVDFVWADLPVLTNAGDPLGNELVDRHAAFYLNSLSEDGIASSLIKSLEDKENTRIIRENINKFKKKLFWDVVTEELSNLISTHHKAKDLTKSGQYSIGENDNGNTSLKVTSLVKKAKMVPVYAQKHGLRNTYFVARTKIGNRIGRKIKLYRKDPGIVMISHQLDYSGAPHVFMDLTEDLKQETNLPIEFHTFNPVAKDNLLRLNKMGIKPKIHLIKELAIPFVRGDVVVLNTVAHSSVLKYSIYNSLDSGEIKQLIWFIHEDEPEIIFKKKELARVKKLLQEDKIKIFVAAEKTLKNYQTTFGLDKNIYKQPYKYLIPSEFTKIRSEKDFEKISFILPGTIGDGRKGQLPIFYAFIDFYNHYYKTKPDKYRDFELVYVGMTEDFLSRQLLKHESSLEGKFKHHGRVTHNESLALTYKSNFTICYSLRECLPLFVFEGMAAGHPILRNDSSGAEEQLFEGKNGFKLESEDYQQVVNTIEEVLNLEKTSNSKLAEMSKYSNRVALQQANHTYGTIIESILESEGVKS